MKNADFQASCSTDCAKTTGRGKESRSAHAPFTANGAAPLRDAFDDWPKLIQRFVEIIGKNRHALRRRNLDEKNQAPPAFFPCCLGMPLLARSRCCLTSTRVRKELCHLRKDTNPTFASLASVFEHETTPATTPMTLVIGASANIMGIPKKKL
jgi:hypothetical protein